MTMHALNAAFNGMALSCPGPGPGTGTGPGSGMGTGPGPGTGTGPALSGECIAIMRSTGEPGQGETQQRSQPVFHAAMTVNFKCLEAWTG